ncbi:MAG: hypothetical protein R3C59_23275 [Planctomycetaceae bacterium]
MNQHLSDAVENIAATKILNALNDGVRTEPSKPASNGTMVSSGPAHVIKNSESPAQQGFYTFRSSENSASYGTAMVVVRRCFRGQKHHDANDASVTSGKCGEWAKFEYNDFGQLTHDYQSHFRHSERDDHTKCPVWLRQRCG